MANWIAAGDYVKQMQQYNDNHHLVFDSFNLDKETAVNKTPGTIILVIGESSSRDYMKVYNPNFPYDDTPWQGNMRSDNKTLSSLIMPIHRTYKQYQPWSVHYLNEINMMINHFLIQPIS